ncbi:PIF1-like helicase [Hirsutella rhossiliensis]
MRSSVSCEIWTASAPKTEPAAVKLNPDLLHRRRRPPLHHRNDLDKSKRLSLRRRRSQGAPPKRPRPMRETVQLQRDSVESILHHYNATFRVKEQASSTRSWCNEVPVALQVEAAKSFYQAFTEERTLPISHCVFCYRKTPPCELATIQWRDRLSPSMLQATKTVQECGACLPSHEGARVDVCRECRAGFDSGRLPKACSVNNMAIGCEHRYPEELDDLSPVEERLIALHAPFGYITKFTVDNETRSGISYRKHVKGHIVVFPNKVDDLVATVLPHPLLQAIENIHVSWSGPGKPGSADVRHLLQVRKSRVAAALAWLQRNNPLYEDIAINQAEIDVWQYADGSSVPTVIMDRMRREEPSTVEKTQTDHIVPDTDRGLEENSFRSIDELVNSINPTFAAESCDLDRTLSTEQTQPSPGEPATLVPDSAAIGLEVDAVCEMSASGMFPLNGPAAFAESDKLSFLADIVNANPDRHGNSVPLEQAYANLTEDRLKRAEAEMRETRTTSDPDISLLLRELSIFGHAQPLSNESRLLMRRKIQALDIRAEEVMASTSALTAAFDDESNFIAYCCQVHSHTYTCLKYSLKGIVEQGFTEDGLLQIRRNHPLVNRYNKSLAVGLRHNHDVSMILTKTKGLAMVYYITNYATKLETPMWKRIALAAEVARQLREAGGTRLRTPGPTLPDDRQQVVLNESRQFLMRTANRIFSERQLSAVEVCYHLLGYDTDFTNVPHWSFLNLTALYWTIFRLWAHLRHQAGELTDAEQPPETIPLRQGGRTLLCLDVYAYRGHVLQDLCLYDYMSMVHLGSDRDGWMQKLRRPDQYAVPIFQGYISDDHEDDHPVYVKRNSVLHLALFVPWENFISESQGDITSIWTRHRAGLCPRLRFHVSNICLLRKSAEDARKDAKLWASRSEGNDTIDVEYPLDAGRCEEEPPAMAHRQAYKALLQILRNAVQDTDATKDSPVLGGLIRDLCEENPAEEEQPFVQRQEDLYRNIPHDQGDALCQFPISRDDVQAAAKAQQLLHLRMLDDIEGGSQGTILSTDGADIDDTLARYGDTETTIAHPGSDLNQQGPRMLVDVSPVTSFAEMGHTAAATFTLNYLQTVALQLVCAFLDRYTANQDSAGQHLQYTGGPGGTGKSTIIDALKDVFAARNQPHLLQITGTSGSSAVQIGGTTIHSACGLDSHRDPNKPPPPFSEAKKWIWKQKLVLVIDEVSMLGGATLHNVSRHLQALRDCPDEPFGGMPVVLLMGDFYQFAPVRETSLLINRPPDRTQTPLRQATISHHSGCRLWHLFKTVVLLEDQVRARNDPQLRALLDRVRNGRQTQQDLSLLNANIVGRSQITFHDAVVGWARFNRQHIRIFVSTHTWRNGTLSPNIVARTIGQGDNSACKVPGVFFYAQGMPVVVNKNIYTGLKVVNGADFTAVDVILDPNHPGYHLADDVTIHFGPPLGILLQSEETKALAIPSLPGKTCDFTSLYVQLSRCTSLRGIKLLGPVRQHDFIGNGLDPAIIDGMQRLKNLAAETRRLYEDQGFEK